MKVRIAEISDFERIKEIYEQVDKLHRESHPDRFKKPTFIGRTNEYLIELLENEKSQLYVATYKEKVIGFAEAYVNSSPDFPVLRKRTWLQIDTIAVDDKFQGNGVGQLLLDKLYKWANEQDIDEVELKVYSFNESAIKFYEKNGFTDISKIMTKKI